MSSALNDCQYKLRNFLHDPFVSLNFWEGTLRSKSSASTNIHYALTPSRNFTDLLLWAETDSDQFCQLLVWCRIVQKPDGSDWVLGAGNYGTVLKGVRGDVQPVAVKIMKRTDKWTEQNFIREIAMMKCAKWRCTLCWLCYTTCLMFMGEWL